MTTDYVESSGFKRRYFAPLVVLVLCVVALTGSAFAYSTQVSGNGDISGNYVYLDLYEYKEGKYVVTSNFQIDNNAFKVYTQTDKTVADETAPYKAYVEPVTLTYSAYIEISASAGLSEQLFTLTGSLKYTLPAGSGSILVDNFQPGSEGDITGRITVSEPSDSLANPDRTQLKANHTYLVTITLDITGGDANNVFGSYSDADTAINAVKAFNSSTPELTITLSASPYVKPDGNN